MILNKYPYTNGHLMVAPYEHVAELQGLDDQTMAEIMSLAQRGIGALERSYAPHGYNVGFNQGRVAGAGVEHHIHMHVVPRWGGDTNFMPVLGDTRVMNQSAPRQLRDAEGSVRLTWRSPPRRPASSRPTTSAGSTARSSTARPRT